MTGTNWSNITDFAQIPAEANNNSGGSFWVSVLFMLWIIIMMALIGYGFVTALVTSSFIALILGIILLYAGLISLKFVLVFAGILLFMFLYIMFLEKEKY